MPDALSVNCNIGQSLNDVTGGLNEVENC